MEKTFETNHRVLAGDARDLGHLPDASVHLVVTSPPYPMIGMWDGVFGEMAPAAATALAEGRATDAFEAMHAELDRVWAGCHRVLVEGGLACVNIGDATRTIGGVFRLHANHARAILGLERAGFMTLPDILWRKPTNAPNKFMGSGMLPPGAYVTYEHEYVLILRKGAKRAFAPGPESERRRRSAFFWEERNTWFSDVWMDLVGARQELGDADSRARSAAFPFELPFRLIQMYSLEGDTVLDPFGGLGTTMAAAIASGRSSIVVERDSALQRQVARTASQALRLGQERQRARLAAHAAFVAERTLAGRPPGHCNDPYGFPVVTAQESDLRLTVPVRLDRAPPDRWLVAHEPLTLAAAADREPSLPFADPGN